MSYPSLDAFISEVTQSLIDKHATPNTAYVVDIEKSETRVVFMQLVHPTLITGQSTAFMMGIHFTVQAEDEVFGQTELFSDLEVIKIQEDEGLEAYYQVFSLDKKTDFQATFKAVLEKVYQLNDTHAAGLTFSFQGK